MEPEQLCLSSRSGHLAGPGGSELSISLNKVYAYGRLRDKGPVGRAITRNRWFQTPAGKLRAAALVDAPREYISAPKSGCPVLYQGALSRHWDETADCNPHFLYEHI